MREQNCSPKISGEPFQNLTQVSHLRTASSKVVWGNNLDSNIFFSYIIPTIGRRSLDIAVNSILNQNFDHAKFEVIVVNDSGQSLPFADWRAFPCVKMLNTNKSERSFPRNSGAAISQGTYIAFLDDDDWILPGALKSFWKLANKSPNAGWLYGGIRIVDEQGRALAEINAGLTGNCFSQILGGAWAPFKASVIQSRAFYQIGGFNPLINRTEDEDLCRRIASVGDFANTSDVVACLFTRTNVEYIHELPAHARGHKISRDLILSAPGIF